MIAVLFYVGFGVFIVYRQESIIYHPWEQDFESCPAFSGAEKVERNGTRMYVSEGEKGTVVLYHGNAGSACDRAYYADTISMAKYGYVIVEYAGYSNDPRQTTHELVKQDVRNVIDYLSERGLSDPVLIGESIGTGPASYHASLQQPRNMLLIAPFTSLADLAQEMFWYYPARRMTDNAFDNEENLRAYEGDITIMHGDADEIIDQKWGRQLFESVPSPRKKFISVPGYGHNDLFDSPQSYRTMEEFLAGK